MADQPAGQSKATNPAQAPDPSMNYERSHPDRESPSGQLTDPRPGPAPDPDKIEQTVDNRHDGTRQINGMDGPTSEQRSAKSSDRPAADLPLPGTVASDQPDHSMKEEEPTGWDQAPQGHLPPEDSRQPRTGGKGGTPDEGEPESAG